MVPACGMGKLLCYVIYWVIRYGWVIGDRMMDDGL